MKVFAILLLTYQQELVLFSMFPEILVSFKSHLDEIKVYSDIIRSGFIYRTKQNYILRSNRAPLWV